MTDWNDTESINIRAFADYQRRSEQDERKASGEAKTNGAHHDNVVPIKRVPNFQAWDNREIAPRDWLLGNFISTTSRILITGPTGLGKTMLGIALAFALEGGAQFLHWKAGRAARVLYIDGEMSAEEMQDRLRQEAARCGRKPENLFVLSREDFDEMPPLNTPEGQAWMDAKIEETNPDLIIFDNIQALVIGDHTKEESWAPVLPWVRSLTKRKRGQAWMHHTGHNEGHSYGTKTREWQLDACLLMERVADADDLTFTIKFTKARGRRPENREDFADTTIGLRNNKWVVTQAGKKRDKVPESARIAFDLLRKAINEAGELPPVGDHVQAGVRGVRVSLWQKYCETGTISKSDSPDAFRMAFKRSADTLQARGLIQVWADWVWIA
jgi:hypothetical protein